MLNYNYVSTFWGRVASSALCELVNLFGGMVSFPGRDVYRDRKKDKDVFPRDRIFNQWRTFWIFFGQILSLTQSCREALKKAQVWLFMSNISLSMPDSEENQGLYPQPESQKKGCGFPVMRWVAVFSLVTGILLDSRRGNLQTHERTLWHQMWCCYEEGDVVLADRAFCSLADYWMLSNKKVDCVMRLHQRRKIESESIKKLGKNDCLVQWKKSGTCPNWLSMQQWETIPSSITVRQVTVTINNPGFRTKKITLATTLLDNKKYPPQALADLYRRRWLAELFIRDLKTTMRMDVLHCTTPELVHKELSIFSIAYNFVRFLIWQAAIEKGIDPYRISFTGTLATIRQWIPILPFIESEEEKRIFMQVFFQILASDIIPIRERKRQPRALKRRPKNFQLLTKPRDEFMEIPHRHKYRKNA
ncbi:MAG: IS4 family transposase [Candidatus Aminicenantes bacterium]|nr:MAG: IS4 family transposase [Candidatus Aminicenantes bacterium]